MQCSVIVPLYNKAATVARTLASIQAQTIEDFEVIVVDDGSTDDSAAKAETFLRNTQDPRFRLIRQANAGPGAARNRGIAEARGPLVAFLDADDEWLPEFLHRTVSVLADHPETGAVCTGWFDIRSNSPERHSSRDFLRALHLDSALYRIQPGSDPRFVVSLNIAMSPCSTVARKEIVQRLGGFYEHRCRFGEDAHLWLKLCLNHPVQVLTDEGAIFHREDSELSGNYRGMRPVEPFLENPEDIRAFCPQALARLLDQVLAIRAMKTACVLAYWGEWRRARDLRTRYVVPGAWRLPWFFPSLAAASPLGGLAGMTLRSLRWRR